ncbi:hypothetical protein ACI1K4_000319 [Salmonella enterica subsp. enterica serovar Anatum]
MEKNKIRDGCLYTFRHGTTYIWGVYFSGTNQRYGIDCGIIKVIEGVINFYKKMDFTTKDKMTYEIV